VLHVVSDPPVQLGEWDRNEWNPNLGHELDALMSEHHDDSGHCDSKFSASYLTDEGRIIRTKTFTARSRPREITASDAAGLAAAMDGSLQATNTLVQQTALAMVRMYLTAQQAQTQAQIQITQMMVQQAQASEKRVDQAREIAHELKEALLEMQSSQSELSPAQEKFFEVMTMAVPGLLSKVG
jgi:signal transduction histidine kinase